MLLAINNDKLILVLHFIHCYYYFYPKSEIEKYERTYSW